MLRHVPTFQRDLEVILKVIFRFGGNFGGIFRFGGNFEGNFLDLEVIWR